MSTENHIPVMLDEVINSLSPQDNEIYIDGTLGAGGYSLGILNAANCIVYGIDRDPNAIETGRKLEKDYPGRFFFLQGCFGDVTELLSQKSINKVNGFVLDIGVSSMQLDQADRGFSFRYDGPLDMRMDTKSHGPTAADIVNTYDEEDLANILYQYGEEKKSRRIAKAIMLRRKEAPFQTTQDLADVIRTAIPKRAKDKIDPATRSFQALRIAVNDELGELERALNASKTLLDDDGRLVVVTFHSLEDRIVKDFIKTQTGNLPSGSRHAPAQEQQCPIFRTSQRKALLAGESEIENNSRSRSAKLRYAVKNETAQGAPA